MSACFMVPKKSWLKMALLVMLAFGTAGVYSSPPAQAAMASGSSVSGLWPRQLVCERLVQIKSGSLILVSEMSELAWG